MKLGLELRIGETKMLDSVHTNLFEVERRMILFTLTSCICREFLVKPEGETLWNQLEFNLRKRIHREA